MNKATVSKAVRIATIERAAGSKPGLPGNLIINRPRTGDVLPQNWFSTREFRNGLLGQGLNPNLPVFFFIGTTINYEELTVTQEDLTAGGGVYKHQFPGKDALTGEPRMVEYKKPGVHNIGMRLDIQSLNIEKAMALADLSMKYANTQRATLTTAPTVEAIVEEVIEPVVTTEDIPHTEIPAGGIPPVVHEELQEETAK